MSIFLMTFSDSEKSEFWDTPMAHMVTCFGNYHFLPLFLSTYSIPRILLEFAPPPKKFQEMRISTTQDFFQRQDIVWVRGWWLVNDRLFRSHLGGFEMSFRQLCAAKVRHRDRWPWRDGRLQSTAGWLFFFFEIERDMMAMKWRWICFWVCFDEFLLKSRMHPETLWKILGKLKIQSQNLTWRLVLLLQLWVCLEKWIAMFQSLLGKCHRHFLLPAAMVFFSDLPTWDSTLLTISESTRYFHARIWTSFLWNWSKKASSTKGEIRGEERDKKLRSW